MEFVEVLLVEDNPADARLIKEACSGFAIKNEVFVVDNGVDAMEYLFKQGKYENCKTPNLIILDLNLPKKGGREVLKEIKSDSDLKLIPVIVLTTSSNEEDICESYMHYANAYITKPTDFNEFEDVICDFENFWFKRAVLPECKTCKKDKND